MKRITPEFRKMKKLTRKDYKKLENLNRRSLFTDTARISSKIFIHRVRLMYKKGMGRLIFKKGVK